MIVKHFYRNEWQLGGDWENTDHVFEAPDSDMQVEQTEKSIAASLEISDDEQDMEEEEDDDCLSNISYIPLVIAFVYKQDLLIHTVRTPTLFGVRGPKFEVRTPTHSELQPELQPDSELACDRLRTSARGRISPYSEYRNRCKQTE